MYPMALGVDASEEGICLTYGMPDLSESTGQGKEEEDGGSRVLQISGADFTRIEKMYDQSQEKLLDMGHLQVLVMGRTLVEDGRWRMVLDYLKQEIPKIRLIEPEGTYLLWLDFRALGMTEKERENLIVNQAKLWLDSGAIFGQVGEGFERINVACPRATIKEALDRLKAVITA